MTSRPLRLFCALGVFTLVMVCWAAAWPELWQLWVGLCRPYHFGPPPNALSVGGALWVALGAALLPLARRLRLPVWTLGALLPGVFAAVAGLWGQVPQGRSWAAADKEILEVAHRLQKGMAQRLAATGQVPQALSQWEAELAAAAPGSSPARTRLFAQLPYRVERLEERPPRPRPLVPATLLIWVAPSGRSFEIHPVGFDPSAKVALLSDAEGQPVVLEGAVAEGHDL